MKDEAGFELDDDGLSDVLRNADWNKWHCQFCEEPLADGDALVRGICTDCNES